MTHKEECERDGALVSCVMRKNFLTILAKDNTDCEIN